MSGVTTAPERPSAWSTRPLTDADLGCVRALYRAVWGYNRPETYDRWRYFESPDGICPGVLAVDGDVACGLYVAWPVTLRLGREVVLGMQSMDTMTHPGYQGQGLFTTLADACYRLASERGFAVVYGFPNPLSYPGFVRRLNLDHTGDIAHWVRPVRPSRHARVPAALGPLADLAARMWPRGSTAGLEVRVEKPAREALAPLLGQWGEEAEVCRIERVPEWLEWRYHERAGHGYEWVSAWQGERLVAAGAWGMRGRDWGQAYDGRAHLLELLGADRAGREAVLAAVIDRARERDAWLLETLTNVAGVISSLRRAGFVRHREAPFIVRALTARTLGANVHTHAAWRIMGGDVDTL